MDEPNERVMLITIRARLEDGAAPVIRAQQHLLWPTGERAASEERSTVGARPDEVIAVVREWLDEFIGR